MIRIIFKNVRDHLIKIAEKGDLENDFKMRRGNEAQTRSKECKEVIDTDLLKRWGGVLKNYDKDEYIFKEGQISQFYHQVIEGKIRMVNEMDDGKDFIQGFFSAGQSFGEPPIFESGDYPSSAIAVQPSVIIRLNISSFKQLLKENFDVHWNVTRLLAQRLRKKAITLKEISCHSPEHRIVSLLDHFKRESQNGETTDGKVRIDYTRQQIADMSGLRVETVIRVMRNLNSKNVLIIKKGKCFINGLDSSIYHY